MIELKKCLGGFVVTLIRHDLVSAAVVIDMCKQRSNKTSSTVHLTRKLSRQSLPVINFTIRVILVLFNSTFYPSSTTSGLHFTPNGAFIYAKKVIRPAAEVNARFYHWSQPIRSKDRSPFIANWCRMCILVVQVNNVYLSSAGE